LNPKEKEKIRPEVEKALEMWHEGELERALETLVPLTKLYPDYPAVFGALGGIYHSKGDHLKAAECFRRVVQLSPTRELPSLGLFHSLLELGHVEEALSEMKRFLSVASSKEYERLMTEVNSAAWKRPKGNEI
jgi:predicted Zn-dependent protease